MRKLTKNEINEVNAGLAVVGAIATAFVVGAIIGYATEKYKQATAPKKPETGVGCEPTC